MKKMPLTKLLHLCLGLGLWLAFSQNLAAVAQTPVCNIQNRPPVSGAGWVQGATVLVYIDPAILSPRREQVEQAFNNWTNNNSANGSFVTFTFINQPPAPNTGFTVLNQQHPEGTREHTDTMINDNTGYSMSATTYLAPTLTNPPAVLEAMSHGIGHTFGYSDCDYCSPTSSIMATSQRYTNDNDVIGRATSPTACDSQQLQFVNYPRCSGTGSFDCAQAGNFWNEETCTCEPHNIGGSGDAGGFEYTCTNYYWYRYESIDGGKTWKLAEVSYAGCW